MWKIYKEAKIFHQLFNLDSLAAELIETGIKGLEELKIWAHVFLCMPIQVCVHIVYAANFVHMNYLCEHTCMQIVYATVYVIMYYM